MSRLVTRVRTILINRPPDGGCERPDENQDLSGRLSFPRPDYKEVRPDH
jgi:hypothetical protein